MLRFSVGLVVLLVGLSARAGTDPFPLGARAWGMGGAAVTLADGWAFWNNAGAMGRLEHPQVLFAYDLRFGMAGLQTLAAGYVRPLRKGVAAAGFTCFGDDLYSAGTAAAAYAFSWEKITAGIKTSYLTTRMAETEARHALVLEMGGTVQLLPELVLGAYVYNPLRSRLNRHTGERLPTVLKAGLCYQPVASLRLTTELEKDIAFPAVFRAGLEYEIVRNLRLRTGFGSRPQVMAFGVGFSPARLHVDYGIRTHPALGLSHHVSLGVPLRRKKATPATAPTDDIPN